MLNITNRVTGASPGALLRYILMALTMRNLLNYVFTGFVLFGSDIAYARCTAKPCYIAKVKVTHCEKVDMKYSTHAIYDGKYTAKEIDC